MKRAIIIFGFTLFTFYSFAFHGFNQGNSEKIQKMKVTFLTEKLDLSVEEAQAFWPLYNEYENKKQELREKFKPAYKNQEFDVETLSESELQQFIDGKLEYDKAKLKLKTDYHESLKKIFSTKKIALLYSSEHDFKKYLFSEMKNRSMDCNGKMGKE